MTLTYLTNRHNIHDSPWTDELIARLKELWAEGYSASRVANELHTTRNSILGKVHRLQLPQRRPRRAVRKMPRHKPMRQPKPAPLLPSPAIPVTLPPMRCLGFFDLMPLQCHFPIGDPMLPGFCFCAADAGKGDVYCPFHQSMARRV